MQVAPSRTFGISACTCLCQVRRCLNLKHGEHLLRLVPVSHRQRFISWLQDNAGWLDNVLEGHVDVFGRTEEIHYGHHSVHEAGKGAGK